MRSTIAVLAARATLIAAVPASAAAAAALSSAHLLTDADHATALGVGIVAAALVGLAAAVGPTAFHGASRVGAVGIVLAATATLLAGATAWLILAVLDLCTSSAGPGLAALAAAAAVYLPGSAHVLRTSGRAAWAWPLVIALALAVSLAVLAVATGGPHHCET